MGRTPNICHLPERGHFHTSFDAQLLYVGENPSQLGQVFPNPAIMSNSCCTPRPLSDSVP